VLFGLALALGLIAWRSQHKPVPPSTPIGLFTSLPILWGNTPDLTSELRGERAAHWAKAVLTEHGQVVALDTLTSAPGPRSLAGLRRLIIAQPRALSPQENLALDDWVRSGGHLLLLADPAYTEESPFALGDPRRPQATALLSPILTRWGLELQFDADQPLAETDREVMGVAVPVILPGRFLTRGQANCRLWGEGLAVTCAIGRGRVFAVADAALLERDDPSGQRANAFGQLLDSAFLAH
jgi:hypothetical protein